MNLVQWLIFGLWLVLLVYWLVSATKAKRTIWKRKWAGAVAMRVAVIVAVLIAIRIPGARRVLLAWALPTHSTMLALIGLVMSAAGVGLAIAARVRLGRNWGMPGTEKENPELITRGPYAVVRHPIYTGFLLAILGTAIGITPIWLLVFVISAVFFVFSARQEERIMRERFPDTYPAYVERTKMLVPFIL